MQIVYPTYDLLKVADRASSLMAKNCVIVLPKQACALIRIHYLSQIVHGQSDSCMCALHHSSLQASMGPVNICHMKIITGVNAGMSLINNIVILEHDSEKVPPNHKEVLEAAHMRPAD